MRRPWRSLRQLIDILLGQIAGVLVIPDAPVFHDESDRLFLPRFQQCGCAVSEILQLIGQRETTRIRAQQHAVATCRIFTQPVQLILRALHQRHIAESVHPEIMLILRPVRKRFRPFDIQRHNRQRTEPAWSIQLHAGLLLVGANQQQTDQIAVTLHLAMQTDQCAFTVADSACGCRSPVPMRSEFPAADARHGHPTIPAWPWFWRYARHEPQTATNRRRPARDTN